MEEKSLKPAELENPIAQQFKYTGIIEEITGDGITSTIEGSGILSIATYGFWEGVLVIEVTTEPGENWEMIQLINNVDQEPPCNTSSTFKLESSSLVRVKAMYWQSGTCEIVMQFQSDNRPSRQFILG